MRAFFPERADSAPRPAAAAGKRGFTIIEAITVVALIGVTLLMAMPFLRDTNAKKDLENASAEALDAVREAQASVMSGKDDRCYGVHFQGDRFVFFALAASGCTAGTYATRDVAYDVAHLPKNASVTAVTLTPGGACALPAGTGNCDLVFKSHRGAPVQTGSVTFTDVDGVVKTLTVNAVGMADVQ